MIISSIRGVSSTRLPGEVPLLLPISHPPVDLEDYVNLTHKARNLHQGQGRVNRNFPAFRTGPGDGLALSTGGLRAAVGLQRDGTVRPRGVEDRRAPRGAGRGRHGAPDIHVVEG